MGACMRVCVYAGVRVCGCACVLACVSVLLCVCNAQSRTRQMTAARMSNRKKRPSPRTRQSLGVEKGPACMPLLRLYFAFTSKKKHAGELLIPLFKSGVRRRRQRRPRTSPLASSALPALWWGSCALLTTRQLAVLPRDLGYSASHTPRPAPGPHRRRGPRSQTPSRGSL